MMIREKKNSIIPLNFFFELLTLTLTFVAFFIVNFSRIGSESYLLLTFKGLFLALFLILTPFTISNLLKYNSKFIFVYSKSFIFFICLFLVFLFGLIKEMLNIDFIYFIYLFSLISTTYYFYKIFFNNNFKDNIKFFNLCLYVGIFLLISIFFVIAYYSNNYFNPLFLEKISSGSYSHRDSVWQSAISAMFKTYTVPSIGLDGIIYLNYHFFSHILFSQFSSLIGISSIEFYSLFVPILIIPIFVLLFLFCIENLIILYNIIQNEIFVNISPYFFLLVLVLFSFPFPYHILPEHYHYLMSQTYLVGLTMFFLFFSTMISFVISFKKEKFYKIDSFLFIFLTSLFLILIAYSKISVAFVFYIIFGYFYLRIKLYKYTFINISLIFIILASFVILFDIIIPLSRDYPSNSWQSTYLESLKNYFFYIYPSICFILYKFFYYLKFRKLKNIIFLKKQYEIELLIILLIVLFFIPYQYFKGIQIFVAYIFILSNYNKILELLLK